MYKINAVKLNFYVVRIYRNFLKIYLLLNSLVDIKYYLTNLKYLLSKWYIYLNLIDFKCIIHCIQDS